MKQLRRIEVKMQDEKRREVEALQLQLLRHNVETDAKAMLNVRANVTEQMEFLLHMSRVLELLRPHSGARASPPASHETGSSESAVVEQRMISRLDAERGVRYFDTIAEKMRHAIFEHEVLVDEDRLVDRGAFKLVYRSTWRGVDVAVKVLLVKRGEDLSQAKERELIKQMRKEGAITERLGLHPHIAHYCGYLRRENVRGLSIVETWYPFGNMRACLERYPQTAWKVRMRCMVQAASGLWHLHQCRVVHRDMALRNILLAADWSAKIADFGLARILMGAVDEANQTTGFIGAVRWLAPEAVHHSVYSTKSDVYAFGMVLWECMALRDPYHNIKSLLSVAYAIMKRNMRPVIPSTCPKRLKTLIEMCWASSPTARPTMDRVYEMLLAYYEEVKENTPVPDFSSLDQVPPFDASKELESLKAQNRKSSQKKLKRGRTKGEISTSMSTSTNSTATGAMGESGRSTHESRSGYYHSNIVPSTSTSLGSSFY